MTYKADNHATRLCKNAVPPPRRRKFVMMQKMQKSFSFIVIKRIIALNEARKALLAIAASDFDDRMVRCE